MSFTGENHLQGQRSRYNLKPVQTNNTLSDQAYNVIKEAILTLELKPGTPLLEDDLAEQLGISKTPVRDVLRVLERDGLVVRIPFKGTYVSEITEQDAREILELRAVLEGLAGRQVSTSITKEELDHAETILDAFDVALASGDVQETSILGASFHRFLTSHTSNLRLLTFLEMLDGQMRRLRLVSDQGIGRLQKSSYEHRRILSAFREGDPNVVEQAFRDHHHSVLNDLILPNSSDGT